MALYWSNLRRRVGLCDSACTAYGKESHQAGQHHQHPFAQRRNRRHAAVVGNCDATRIADLACCWVGVTRLSIRQSQHDRVASDGHIGGPIYPVAINQLVVLGIGRDGVRVGLCNGDRASWPTAQYREAECTIGESPTCRRSGWHDVLGRSILETCTTAACDGCRHAAASSGAGVAGG